MICIKIVMQLLLLFALFQSIIADGVYNCSVINNYWSPECISLWSLNNANGCVRCIDETCVCACYLWRNVCIDDNTYGLNVVLVILGSFIGSICIISLIARILYMRRNTVTSLPMSDNNL